ncbi:hypothetical protein BJX68DRAFT_263163 [Aspergillus pseudodeflectus]|uniref:F-box domain-containing protein n=1 Tax=Aspergillus pseudodeflectus TaxID=176178 RepID=A0ABR4KZ82_9EURO
MRFPVSPFSPRSPPQCCPLCGIPFHPDGNPEFSTRSRMVPPTPAAWSTEPRPWSTEARAMVARNVERGDIYLSGLGVVRVMNKIYIPLDDTASYRETTQMHGLLMSRWPLVCNTHVIGVHDACWSLLRCRVGALASEYELVASLFYQLCAANRVPEGFDLGLEYGATPQTREEAEMADPGRIPSLDEIETAAASSLSCWGAADDSAARITGPFSELSTELVHEVMSYLSLCDLSNLRLTCKTFLAASASLPQTYWRARFVSGNEADFLYPDLQTTRDWRRLFFGLQRCLHQGHPALINRRRIHRAIEPIAALIELTTTLPDTPHGVEVCARPTQRSHHPLRPTQRLETGRFRTRDFQLEGALSAALPPIVEPLRLFYSDRAGIGFHVFSCRAFRPFRKGFAIRKGRIGISTLRIGTRGYISAVKFVPSNEPDDAYASVQQVGFPTGEEEWMEIPHDSRLGGVEVAFRPEGLIGVRFQMKDANTSPWLGQSSGKEVSRGIFTIPTRLKECALLLSFDRYKIVALGPCVFTDRRNEPAPLQGLLTDRKSLDIEKYMWTPHPPLYTGLTVGPLVSCRSPRRSGNYDAIVDPLCNMDFGGPGGSLLSSLTRLVFRMEFAIPFVGVECHYHDQPPRIFGDTSPTACELSFLVDGAAGERITKLDLLARRKSISGIQLSTNHGRTMPFATIQDLGPSETTALPNIPDGEVITGFIASRPEGGLNPSGYAYIGLQTQQPHQPLPSPTTTLYRPIPVPAEEAARRTSHLGQRTPISGVTDYTFHTWAPLTNIRRITASAGIQGRSRSERDISGLMFEYYDDTPSVIVGQWFVPQPHTAVDIEPGERVGEVNVWTRREDRPLPGWYSSRPLVTITGIRIYVQASTGSSRTLAFAAPGIDIATLEDESGCSVHWKRAGADHGDEHNIEITTLAWEVSRKQDSLHTTCSLC